MLAKELSGGAERMRFDRQKPNLVIRILRTERKIEKDQ